MPESKESRFRRLIQRMLGWARPARRTEPEPPVDPYAYVTAPRKPRPSNRGAAAVAELPEE